MCIKFPSICIDYKGQEVMFVLGIIVAHASHGALVSDVTLDNVVVVDT
jgi:hypothetical protein